MLNTREVKPQKAAVRMLEVGSGEKLQPALDWKVLPQCLHLPLIWRRAAQWCSTPAAHGTYTSGPDMLAMVAMFDNGQNREYNSVVITSTP